MLARPSEIPQALTELAAQTPTATAWAMAEVAKPAADWTAFRVGVRYDPPLLALEWKGDEKTLRKDIPFPEVTELAALVAEVADDECAAAVLDHMVKTHGAQWLDFEKFFSKKQVLRLVDMVLQGGPDSVEM